MRFLRTPFGLTVLATVLAWIIGGVTVARSLPTDLGALGWLVFYGIAFLATAGTATIIGLLIRRGHADHTRAVHIAVRQGVLAGLAITIALALQSRRLLSWVNILFLIAALTLLELFWISVAAKRSPEINPATE